MRFKSTTVFLDGADRFEVEDQRTISDERGAYFVANGWGVDLDGRVAVEPHGGVKESTLDIHNTVMGQEAANG